MKNSNPKNPKLFPVYDFWYFPEMPGFFNPMEFFWDFYPRLSKNEIGIVFPEIRSQNLEVPKNRSWKNGTLNWHYIFLFLFQC